MFLRLIYFIDVRLVEKTKHFYFKITNQLPQIIAYELIRIAELLHLTATFVFL